MAALHFLRQKQFVKPYLPTLSPPQSSNSSPPSFSLSPPSSPIHTHTQTYTRKTHSRARTSSPGEARGARAGGVGSAQQRRSVVSAAPRIPSSVSRLLDSQGAASASSPQPSVRYSANGRRDTAGSAAGTYPARFAYSSNSSGGKPRTEARSVRSASRRPPARIPAFLPENGRIHRQPR